MTGTMDMTMDPGEETRAKIRYASVLSDAATRLHFTYNELEALAVIYHKIQRNKDGLDKSVEMTRSQFRDVLYTAFDLTDDTLMERIFVALDKGVSNYVTMNTWVECMSLWLRGTLDEKIVYCYNVYDTMGNGLIKREAIFHLLRGSIIKPLDEESDEGVRDMVDVIVKRFDLDRDGLISFEDYSTTVQQAPLMLQAMGECIPSRPAVHAFLSSFLDDCGVI